MAVKRKVSLTAFDFETGDGESAEPQIITFANKTDDTMALIMTVNGVTYEFSGEDAAELYVAVRVLNRESGRVVITRQRTPTETAAAS